MPLAIKFWLSIHTPTAMSTNQFRESWLNHTRIPRTELLEIIQTNSSPKNIASSLNEAEIGHIKERGNWHHNKKYGYPHWKVCVICEQIFQCHDRYQAARNKVCGENCKDKLIGLKNEGNGKPPEERDNTVLVSCAVCGEEMWRPKSHVERTETHTCSYECNGVIRGKEFGKHGHKGRQNWSEESEQKLKERMTGETNPAWKGGVTKKDRKGNYKKEIMVRCPEEYSEMARSNGYVPKHRLKVARALGRPLDSNEVVHHIDHDNHNNDLNNLALFPSNRAHKLYEHHGEPEPVWRGSEKNTTMG